MQHQDPASASLCLQRPAAAAAAAAALSWFFQRVGGLNCRGWEGEQCHMQHLLHRPYPLLGGNSICADHFCPARLGNPITAPSLLTHLSLCMHFKFWILPYSLNPLFISVLKLTLSLSLFSSISFYFVRIFLSNPNKILSGINILSIFN